MGKKAHLEVSETIEELKRLISKQVKQKNKDRIRSLLYIQTNKYTTRQELSDGLGYHKRTMERWLSKYKSGGMKAMLIPEVLERKSSVVTPQIHRALSERVHDPLNGFSSYVQAQVWVGKEFGVRIKYHWLRQYMINKFKTKIKQPRKSHTKKDEQVKEAFLKTT